MLGTMIPSAKKMQYGSHSLKVTNSKQKERKRRTTRV